MGWICAALVWVVVSLALAATADMYRWTDTNGTVHYTSDLSKVPPAQRGAAETGARESAPAPSPAEPAPPAARGGVQASKLDAGAAALKRERLLTGTPALFHAEPVNGVWGVLMETGYPNGVGTLVARSDGSAEMIFSRGGGVIGGSAVPEINASARRLVDLAAAQKAGLAPAREFPLPAEGQVRFYVLTAAGVMSAQATRAELSNPAHPLAQLHLASHDVITALREASEAQPPARAR